ncbi:carbohydrate ABC transporter permease [Kribbella sandramycini]|uniref:Carbohydrate ABC transporter permease n=1 Tax=Kribbella sandramycini TaxID=60450 RepID=A0A7Y4KYP3_9ACTN|nr:carbohydrate ABC transporter permease [Kribbella sandramycini]MBB6569034.1 multiple sugar transport system permease protein [Kribbella sandramycini]NOL41122.1 carbohydrate ABC transporter permease [Kribbella sandramycini]
MTQRTRWVPTLILLIGALYCVLPVLWIVIAATKTNDELFSTAPFVPAFNGGFFTNLDALFSYNDGIFGRWVLNSVIYAVGGGVLSTAIAGAAGYALGKYRFTGSIMLFRAIVAAVLLPQILLAVPQFLLLAKAGMTNNYAAVLLPQLVSPFAIYLCKIYSEASVPDEIMEAARIDGGSEWRIFRSVGAPLMLPALVTVFLLQFIGIWNNFLLPFVMINDDQLFPLTLGLYGLMIITGGQAAQYSIVIAGVLVSIVPLAILFLSLQRYWKLDLISGGVKL